MVEHVFVDFDGTVVVYEGDTVYFHPEVVCLFNDLAGRGIRWHSNSGRSIEGQLEIIERSAERGLTHWPTMVCCGESFIYERRGTRAYAGVEPWNDEAERRHRAFHRRLQQHVEPHLARWRGWVEPQHIHLEQMGTYFFLLEHSPFYSRLSEEFARVIDEAGGGHLVRNGAWLFAMPFEVNKGALIRHCCELFGWERETIVAVGDHENDLSMLDGSSAGLTGCPANAIPAVKEAVRRSGGHVSLHMGPEGTLDVLRHHLRRGAFGEHRTVP